MAKPRNAKRQKRSQKTERQTENKGSDQIVADEEAQELQTLREFAACATVVEFDMSGRVCLNGSFLPANTFDEIKGLCKVTLPSSLYASFAKIHDEIKANVGVHQMVPWAGVGADTTRLRGFGFLDKERRKQLDDSGIRLYAREKESLGEEEVLEDERANNEACTILADEWKTKAESAAQSLLNILPPIATSPTVKDLIALQPNLHNGAAHLAAHVDFPRHEGFGKVICTVAVRGSATILLVERDGNDADGSQRAWRFRLNQGDCYVLSGNVRNRALHAVLADDDAKGNRESLNLRFGLHTVEEAENEVMRYWEEF